MQASRASAADYRVEVVDRSCARTIKVKDTERWFACVFKGDDLVYTTRRTSYKRHAKMDADYYVQEATRPAPPPATAPLIVRDDPVKRQVFEMADVELVAAAVRISESLLLIDGHLRLNRWQRDFLIGLPKHFEKRASITWGQRRAMRITLKDVIAQLHARRYIVELREDVAREAENVLALLPSRQAPLAR